MTNAEKRELVKRLRMLATSGRATQEDRDIGLIDASDYIESTLPPLKTPGQVLYDAINKHWRSAGHEPLAAYEAAAKDLGIEPQDDWSQP